MSSASLPDGSLPGGFSPDNRSDSRTESNRCQNNKGPLASGSMLFKRFFTLVMLIMTMLFVVVYFYSVPLIQKEVYQIELTSARLALNNTFQLTNTMQANLESYRKQALESHKQRLKAVVDLSEVYIRESFAEAVRNEISQEEARNRIFAGLQTFTYDNGGYIWIVDYDARILSHPDPRMTNLDIVRPNAGEQTGILNRLIQSARQEGEGFYQYLWHRLNEDDATDKLSYVKHFPQWGFVIGSGLYLDDIDTEVEKRKQAMIHELHEALGGVTVGESGYVFIFDKEGNIFTHPNPKHHRTSGFELIDPMTGRPILRELMEVADTGQELNYKWDKPSDPENYIYDKISLVRSLDGLGWYICSTVYVDELRKSSVLLSERILAIGFIATLAAMVMAVFFINRITRPINQLAQTAECIRSGDLTATSGIQRDDEIGVLAQTFDTMVQRLHHNIQTLDDEVQIRTQELAQQEERQRLILDALPAQIAYLDKELNYIFVNQGYADLFERSKDSIVGHSINEVISAEMLTSINHQIAQCLAGEPIVYEYPFKQGGREIITKRTLIPYLSDQGDVIGILNLSLDVTTEKDTEQKLMEAQRMSAAGQLAGGLAHDFNNLLTVIMGNLLAAQEHFGQTEGLNRYITPAIRASRRGADITGRLLAFSRRQTLAPCVVDLKALLQETTELLAGSLPDTIDVICQVETIPQLMIDPGQLENALVNLALNARDAMPDGGCIEFNIRPLTVEQPLHYDDRVPVGEYVEIRVSDTGTGFSDDARALAYEPFFTTKSAGEGSGLGLSMVYGFIKQSRGFIALFNRVEGGASISLLLPVQGIPEKHAFVDAEPEVQTELASGELILLVEDDSDVRSVVRDQLVRLGYTVIEAGDADEGEQLISALDNIEGLVTDVNMPGRLNGFELADMMNQYHPGHPILVISGNEFDPLLLQCGPQFESQCEPRFRLLRKPFDKQALKQALDNTRV